MIDNKKVYSHISKLSDYMIVAEVKIDEIRVKTFENGEYKKEEYIHYEFDDNEHLIKLEELKKVYSYEEAEKLWIKWVDENFENIKAGKVNILSL